MEEGQQRRQRKGNSDNKGGRGGRRKVSVRTGEKEAAKRESATRTKTFKRKGEENRRGDKQI